MFLFANADVLTAISRRAPLLLIVLSLTTTLKG